MKTLKEIYEKYWDSYVTNIRKKSNEFFSDLPNTLIRPISSLVSLNK